MEGIYTSCVLSNWTVFQLGMSNSFPPGHIKVSLQNQNECDTVPTLHANITFYLCDDPNAGQPNVLCNTVLEGIYMGLFIKVT